MYKKTNISSMTQMICRIGIFTALCSVLSLALQIPIFENYYLWLGYIPLAVICAFFGAVEGGIIGALSVVIYCLITSGLRGMPGWTIGNIFIGIVLGILFPMFMKMKNIVIKTILMVITSVVSVCIGIGGLKSITECILYSQPFLVRVAKNTNAVIADVAVLCISIPVIFVLYKIPYIRGLSMKLNKNKE